MNYRDLNLKDVYISYGEENIADSFLTPTLKCTKLYERSVGFFSSGVFEPIMDGVVAMYRNGGKIHLVASPRISPEDVKAMELGYELRETTIQELSERDFNEAISSLNDEKLELLAQLIANNMLEIKIVLTKEYGMYHCKLGILYDFDGNVIAFNGSANDSENALRHNYEEIWIEKSWEPSSEKKINMAKSSFAALWKKTSPFLTVYDFNEAAQRKVWEEVTQRKSKAKLNEEKGVGLYEYQKEAIEAWNKHDHHGFLVMATGTGKTWTAIYAAKGLMETTKAMLVICAPYKHLLKQWAEDLVKVFPKADIILVSSENPIWEKQITDALLAQKYGNGKEIIITTTIASFNLEKFKNTIAKSTKQKILIVDEAHRFTNRPEYLKEEYQYMLGLSATPYSGTSAQTGIELMQFFGGQVYNLPIEKALEKNCLVHYYYEPIFAYSTEEEEKKFNYFSQKIASCFKNNKCINQDLLVTSLRGRLRVISMAQEKMERLPAILSKIKTKDHFVVYCGDGRLFDDQGNEIRHINAVKDILNEKGYKASQFTAQENMDTRMQLVDSFDKGDITALAAIRCLDEGINIPSIKGALILSSNDDYREFVQRRGRILRKHEGKKTATIYDIIVLPSEEMNTWAKIELRRFHEYAKLAINHEELESMLNDLLAQYGLTMEEIDVFDYDDMEVETDE